MLQNAHNALRGGATIGFLAHRHAAKAQAGYTVHVLVQRDGIKAGALIDLFRYRVLQQYPVYIGIVIQLFDFQQQFFCAG
jgi:hypothetical protein